MTRVAVQVGAAWLRVAAEGRLLAEIPAAALPAAGAGLGPVLAGLFETPVDELVVVRPVAGAARDAATTAAASAARTVTTMPAPVAALAQHAAGVISAVVVDVGHTGAEVVLVRAGRVVAARRLGVGGARLDAVTAAVLARAGVAVAAAEARRVREALSLLPEVRVGTPSTTLAADTLHTALAAALQPVTDAVAELLRAGEPAGTDRAPPVLLIGGVARTPLLAELLDAAGVADVRVADRPDTVAVLGALRVPGAAVTAAAVGPEPGTEPGAELDGTWLPPVVPARHRRSRAVLAALAGVAAVVALLATGAARPPPSPPPAPTAGDLVQYGYGVRLPAGWVHTGGLPERRRSLLTPAAAPDGTDLISVERTPLGYDADAEPQRARAELHARFAAAASAGAPLSAFDGDGRFAGRSVVTYHEAGGATGGDVDWYVVLDGDAQLSVGCRHTAAGRGAVGAACATVVGSVHRLD